MRRGLVVFFALVVAAVLVWRGSRRAEPTPVVTAAPVSTAPDLSSWRGVRAAEARRATPLARPAGRPIDLYLAESKYPPRSRPLDRSKNPDLIEWNLRGEEARAVERDPTVDYLYSGDVVFAIGDRPVTTFLRVRRDGVPTDVKITQAFVTVEATAGPPLPPEAKQMIPLRYELVEGQYVSVFRPAELAWVRRQVDLVFHIEFDYGGRSLQRAALAVGYTPKSAAPARFTGQYREAIENGSLVIYAGLEVMAGGWYNFDCNLWDARNEPVGWTRFKGDLQPGQREVRLEFFGKVLTDSRSTSPWHLGELRGFRYDADAAPAEQMMDPPSTTFTTRRYALSAFSPAEWDAPERDRQLQALLDDEATGQAPPIPPESAR